MVTISTSERRAGGGRIGGISRWTAGLVCFAAVLLLAAPSWAAKIVDVRVGHHPTFTRLVFELDNPIGYRLKRGQTDSGSAQLTVSLDAHTGQSRVKVPRSFISGVEIDSTARTTVVRVGLTKSDLRLKEMTLANPPRIVLDLYGKAPKAAAVAAKPVKPAAKPAPKVAATPAPKLAATPAPKAAATPAPKAAATPAPKAAAKPAPKLAATPAPKAAAKSPTAVTDPIVDTPDPIAEPSIDEVDLDDDELALDDLDSEDAMESELELPGIADVVPAPRPAPKAAATPAPRVARVPAPKPEKRRAAAPAPTSATASEKSLLDPMTLGLVVGGLVLLVGGVLFMRRRGGRDAEETASGEVTDAIFAEENPFAEMGAAPAAAPADDGIDLPADPQAPQPMATEVPSSSDAAASGNKGAEMDQTDLSMDSAMSDLSGPPPMPGAGTSDEVIRLVRELERRVAGLESQLDESTSARERLERQVAAQTEELRVQRAAIARTQRAVRNMTRTEEELPTEPALRDPNRPSPGA